MDHDLSRRRFLRTSAVLGASALAPLPLRGVHVSGSDTLKVGVIGCGGRGTGAADNIAKAAPGIVIWALADVFPHRVAQARKDLQGLGEALQVSDERCFTGFDAYQKLLATEVDIVILATPPGFRPGHIHAAIAAGKHVFAEKPVAVDAPGVRRVLAAAEGADKQGLSVVAGTQRRHEAGYIEAIQRVRDGQIGEVMVATAAWNQGSLWVNKREPAWDDMEWQLRNWLYFTWLSGDHIVEQHVHNLDVVNWAFDATPVRALGIGGRQVRTAPDFGHVYDHFTVRYEYSNGARMLSTCRQIDGCTNEVAETLVGTKGICRLASGSYAIDGERPWRFQGKKANPYVQEHRDLIEAIRSGKPVNELRTVANSTMTAILGRMSAYTGQELGWQQALESKLELGPKELAFGTLAVDPVAQPGRTPFA
ncbi:MAG: Gfo/Idh/MocA family oxidoreductase [Planctomycetes bacterium]|nr:Gfo/Idh/MocA family oxidoreductase [Planctomycetota bacterium]